tara:strand:+ start:582 stop:968 length:387 start_codon:yes stop_codon:yes gene_type:complete
MTQIEQVRALLKNSPNGVCGTTFLKHNIPRFGHHIWTLRNENWNIKKTKCNLEGHIHKDLQFIYINDNPHNLNKEELQIEKDIDNAQFNDMNAESIKLERSEKLKMINQMLKDKGLDTRLKERENNNG